MSDVRFSIKADDLLLSLLSTYHQVEHSDAILFFNDVVNKISELQPNIGTGKPFRTVVSFCSKTQKTKSFKYKPISNESIGVPHKPYVVRGFYPETPIPFKLTYVVWPFYSYCKVILGNKDHHTNFEGEQIYKYEKDLVESMLLGVDLDDKNKIPYTERKFKCMSPKGFSLLRRAKKFNS
jgi:hypothetical protein